MVDKALVLVGCALLTAGAWLPIERHPILENLTDSETRITSSLYDYAFPHGDIGRPDGLQSAALELWRTDDGLLLGGFADLVALGVCVAVALVLAVAGRGRWLLAPSLVLAVGFVVEAVLLRRRAMELAAVLPGGTEATPGWYPFAPHGWLAFGLGTLCLVAATWRALDQRAGS